MRLSKIIQTLVLFFILLCSIFLFFNAQKSDRDQDIKQKNERKSPPGIFNTNVPEEDFNIILGRSGPTNITISIIPYHDMTGVIQYGLKSGDYQNQTNEMLFKKGEPLELDINNLLKNSKYYYRFSFKIEGLKDYKKSSEYTFYTQRDKTSEFTFVVQADSHLDQNCDPEIYKKTLENMLQDQPDLFIDLGDTFMTNKYRDDFRDSLMQYIAQRYYFGIICHSTALYLTLGNHDGEGDSSGSGESMTMWANKMRKNYYPNPYPHGIYSGNDIDEPSIGKPENYYAWEWGNALFVVLDPFRYSEKRSDSPWSKTLGEKQYHWLKETLEKSKTQFKFIFIHNLLAGLDGKGRGGAETTPYYEWGGLNSDGINGFKENRPGWSKPLHQLFIDNKVSIVFHGHDHFFAKQDLDGIVYQLVPQPGSKKTNAKGSAEEFNYKNGVILDGPGYMRSLVSSNQIKIDYVMTDLTDKNKNKEIAFSYTIKPR